MQGNEAFNKELATMNPESPAFPFVPHPEYPSDKKWVAETLSGKGPDKPLKNCVLVYLSTSQFKEKIHTQAHTTSEGRRMDAPALRRASDVSRLPPACPAGRQ